MNTKAEEIKTTDGIESPDIPIEEIVEAIDDEIKAVEAERDPVPEQEPEDVQPDKEAVQDAGEAKKGEEDKDEPESVAADDQESKPEPEPEQAAKEDDKEVKPSDEFGDLEKDVPERTRERFETVKSKYDEIVAERDSLIQERDAVKAESDEWVQAITATGTNPEQFGMSLEYLTLVNSEKPEDLEKAYNIMKGELLELGKALGKAAPGVYNPLEDHPDLKQKVDDGYLDEESALEVAKARAITKLNTTADTARAQKTSHQQSIDKALQDVKQLGERLRATDPNFEEKVKVLTPIIETVISSGTPPEKWVSVVEETYKKVPSVVPQPKPREIVPDPLRPTGTSPSSGPLDREPGSALEAVNQALERGY